MHSCDYIAPVRLEEPCIQSTMYTVNHVQFGELQAMRAEQACLRHSRMQAIELFGREWAFDRRRSDWQSLECDRV